MLLNRIEVQNFFSHKYTAVDFTKLPSPTLVKGENGAGKSSLFTEALTFAIFGETKLASIDDAIREGTQEMGVAVRMNLNGQDVEIMRTKKRGKSAKLTLTVDGESIEELLSETQKRIDKMFGLSYNSFLSSIILKQEDAHFFVRQKPDERKKIIREILDLGVYARLEKRAREERAQLKSEIKVEEGAYNSITIEDPTELSVRLAMLQRGLTTLETSLANLESELEEVRAWNQQVTEQKRYRSEIVQANSQALQMIASLDAKIKSGLAEIKNLQSVVAPGSADLVTKGEAFIAQTETEIEALVADCERQREAYRLKTRDAEQDLWYKLQPYTDKVTTLNAQINELRRQETELKADYYLVCPTCQQPVDQSHKTTLLQDIVKRISALTIEATLLHEPIDVGRSELKVLQDNQADWQGALLVKLGRSENTLNEKKKLLVTARAAVTKHLNDQKQYEMAMQKIDSLKSAIADAQESRSAFDCQIKPVPELTLEARDEEKARLSVSKMKDDINKAVRLIASVEAAIEQNEAAIERKAALEQAIKEKMHRIGLFEKLVVAFSNNGIPAAIIETVLPEIEQSANHFLIRMSQGRLSIQFKTTEIMKNGNEKETLEIEVFDGTAWRRFESFSGGEQFRISLAIRLALSKVLSRRANVDLQLLILDEAATALDQPGREEFVQTVLSLTQDFSRIILMSHIPELAGEFENSITLGKSLDGTKIIGGAS